MVTEVPLAPDTAALDAWLASPHPLVIGGERRVAGVADFQVISPRDGRVVGVLPVAGPGDVADAVAAARRTFDEGAWPSTPIPRRQDVLRRFARLVEDRADVLAGLEAIDSGKSLAHTRSNDLPVALDALETAGIAARLRAGDARVLGDGLTIEHQLVEPIGVVAEILPWNGPIWTGVQQIAGIVASGSTAVLKPSEHGAMPLAYMVDLLEEAGLPPGVINVVYGGPETGAALVGDGRLDLISLTGGTRTGAAVMQAAAPNVTRLSLELGGKNPCIVLRDADLDAAAFWGSIGAFSNSGQICVSASRFLVEDAVFDQFVDRLVDRANATVVGDPLDPDSQVGCLVNEVAASRVWRYIESEHGGTVVAGGQRYTDPVRARGAFVPPTVIADVSSDSDLACDEVFGPVAAVIRVRDVDHAVELANSSAYGLSAGVFTRDLASAWSVGRRLRAGEVYVNRWFSPGVLEAPVEGQKRSGFGAAGAAKYQHTKTLIFGT
jgi:acyl-CoA reductase-like NAD-dependent aldehyde dehydrogenase